MITYWDITELVRREQQLEKLASTDSLTGLFNRRHLLQTAEAEWARFQRYYRLLSLLMIDIDHFKQINDRYGHAVGDEAIVSVGRTSTDGKRKSDIVGRIGGDEFAMLLPETDLTQAIIVAGRLCERISDTIMSTHHVQFKVTASIGVATASAAMPGVDSLMRAADEALYLAKSNGKNRFEYWLPLAVDNLAAE